MTIRLNLTPLFKLAECELREISESMTSIRYMDLINLIRPNMIGDCLAFSYGTRKHISNKNNDELIDSIVVNNNKKYCTVFYLDLLRDDSKEGDYYFIQLIDYGREDYGHTVIDNTNLYRDIWLKELRGRMTDEEKLIDNEIQAHIGFIESIMGLEEYEAVLNKDSLISLFIDEYGANNVKYIDSTITEEIEVYCEDTKVWYVEIEQTRYGDEYELYKVKNCFLDHVLYFTD